MTDVGIISIELFLLLILLLAAWSFRIMRRRHLEQCELLKSEIDELELQKINLTDVGLRLLELKEALELEQEKSARLLRNILPERVIQDLREKGSSKPERFDNVTVFFADIVNFTGIAPQLDPAELILELSDIFGEFDRIFARHGCERIKTVGDAYMAAGGLLENQSDHCSCMLMAALEARDYLQQRNHTPGRRCWPMRFGINCGCVIGGIVGREKYLYDILGDTVNIASRIEHASEAMKINVSDSVYQQMHDRFDFTPRGMVSVKGKGAMEMYFLEGVKTQ